MNFKKYWVRTHAMTRWSSSCPVDDQKVIHMSCGHPEGHPLALFW